MSLDVLPGSAVGQQKLVEETRLGCDVVWCAAESDCQPVSVDLLFAHTEVGHLDVAFLVEQHVVQLQISATQRKEFS